MGGERAVFPPAVPATARGLGFEGGETGTGSSSTELEAYSIAIGRFHNERGGVGGGGGTDGARASLAGGETGTGSSPAEPALYSTAVGRFSNERPV
jgi:hypothetical protein